MTTDPTLELAHHLSRLFGFETTNLTRIELVLEVGSLPTLTLTERVFNDRLGDFEKLAQKFILEPVDE